MHRDQPVFARADTLLGICEAIGQDFRFDPIVLRLALGVSLLWNPLVSLGAYAVLGIAVAASRLLSPPRIAPAAAPAAALAAAVTTTAIAPRDGANDDRATPDMIAA